MKVTFTKTGDRRNAMIELLDRGDFALVKKNKAEYPNFNWSKYKGLEVFKLIEEGNSAILGLMLLTEHTDPSINAMEIELLEVGITNMGKSKQIDRIAGCLIAYACRESFKRGHDGYVFLTPKTDLITHYESKYGMFYIPPMGFRLEGQMVIGEATAKKLIKKYLDT